MEEEVQTVTIFRTWVEIAGSLKSDADRGKLYHAICEYALFGIVPELEGALMAFFTLMRPSIDKSNKRKKAQQNSLQKRLQNSLQNAPQSNLQNDLQPQSQNDTARARKTETGTEKKRVTKVTPKEKISFAVLLPDHLQSSLVTAKWQKWEDFRRKKGKPISETAARQQMEMLKNLSGEEAIAAIDNSIANDYQGLFPPKRLSCQNRREKDFTGI